jgi:hypothetical protein
MVNYIHVQNNPELELEIFMRYNKGTNPMTPQEIRHVLYGSKFNTWVESIVEKSKDDPLLSKAFNYTTKRYRDKIVHSDMFVMFSIAHDGLNEKHKKSTAYTDDIMVKAKNMNDESVSRLIEESQYFFDNVVKFVKLLEGMGISLPFSKELYAPEQAKHSFQTSIFMIVISVIRELLKSSFTFTEANISDVKFAIQRGFNASDFRNATSATTKYELVSQASTLIHQEIAHLS